MSHGSFVSVDRAKQESMLSVNIFDFSTLTTSSLVLIQNAKKFSMASCILKTMQHLSTTVFSLPGRHSIESGLGWLEL